MAQKSNKSNSGASNRQSQAYYQERVCTTGMPRSYTCNHPNQIKDQPCATSKWWSEFESS